MKELTPFHFIVMRASAGHFSRYAYATIIYKIDTKGSPFLYHFELLYGDDYKQTKRNAASLGIKFTNGRISLGGLPNMYINPRCGINVAKIAEKLPDFYIEAK